MKTIIAAFALLSLAAGPVFAAGAYVPQSAPQTGYYGISPSNPALTEAAALAIMAPASILRPIAPGSRRVVIHDDQPLAAAMIARAAPAELWPSMVGWAMRLLDFFICGEACRARHRRCGVQKC